MERLFRRSHNLVVVGSSPTRPTAMLVWFRLMLRLNGLVPNSATVFISAWFSVVMSRESQDEGEILTDEQLSDDDLDQVGGGF